MKPAPLSRVARVYVGGVVAVGAAVVAEAVRQLHASPVGAEWFILVALTLLTGSFTISIAALPARVSVSETFVFASVLLFGPAAGTITVVLETLVMSFWLQPKNRSAHRILFNLSAPAIAIWISGSAFFWISGITPYVHHATPLPSLFIPLAAFTALYFLLNTWLVAFALGFEQHRSPLDIWWPHFTWVSVNYFSGASVAALLVTYTNNIDVSTLAVIVPLLLISYLTFRTAMGRVDDATRHLSQLNKLYLSTIETLAMAIDAKDQITHGHIRRVQTYAVGLARIVGVTDEGLIKAIEAAALLHDMGKLAVPEYILNKPGKLTPAEFEKMKLHASVGADILAAIDFPYPVVPIVRHHHESWDGTGYPDGLKGTDIPIGARVLAVVDCFDALTSDRPYRPRLSNDEALRILFERRGTMYDPLIVDTFARNYSELTPEPTPTGPSRQALDEITTANQTISHGADLSRLNDIAASSDEMLTLFELGRSIAGQASVSDTGDIIAKHLRRLIPASLVVCHLYDATSDELEAAYVMGDAASLVKGLRIQLGERLSGWVAANRQTIVNSDAMLDLGELARCVSPRLRSCLSTPLVSKDGLVGVLTLYSAIPDGFTEDHRRVIESVSTQIAYTMRKAVDFDNIARHDKTTGLPNTAQLDRLLRSDLTTGSAKTALLIDTVSLATINAAFGRESGEELLQHVAKTCRMALSVGDLLFRHRSGELIALLGETSAEGVKQIVERLGEALCGTPLTLGTGDTIPVEVMLTSVCYPKDGRSVDDLISAARRTEGKLYASQRDVF